MKNGRRMEGNGRKSGGKWRENGDNLIKEEWREGGKISGVREGFRNRNLVEGGFQKSK
jgi:hypothetical protein